MIREVERHTDVGEGALNALRCDIVAKSMERQHTKMLKNLQKLEEFSLKSRTLMGPARASSSTLQEVVMEAPVEETERAPPEPFNCFARAGLPPELLAVQIEEFRK